MKRFFVSVLRFLGAFVLASILFTFLAIFVISAMIGALASGPVVSIPEKAVLEFDLNLSVPDSPRSVDSLTSLLEAMDPESPEKLHLRALVEAIDNAAEDDRIQAILIRGGSVLGGVNTSLASASEIQRALLRFKETGKPVYGYLDDVSQLDFFLAGVADEIYMHPYCVMTLNGIAYQRMYFAEAFEKYGIGVQSAIAGGFKSALDTFTRTSMSPEDREQGASLIDGLWSVLSGGIAGARGIDALEVDRLSKQVGLLRPEQAVEAGLITGVSHWDVLADELTELVGKDEETGSFKSVALPEYAKSLTQKRGSEVSEIAIVYVEGAIVDGEGQWNEAGSDRIVRNLRKVREDENVKAVVVRVNSPGGSVTASEKIRKEIELIGESRPVVISMGGVAASGGYWISATADSILAEPATITGSIGVFAFLPNVQGLANDIGITFDSVETSSFADLWSIAKPKDAQEIQRLEELVSSIYDRFLLLVAEGRSMTVDDVRKVAEGRVWTGESALEIGLIDQLGGLGMAIDKAAELAGLDDYSVKDVPHDTGWNMFVSMLESKVSGKVALRNPVVRQALEWSAEASLFNDPRGLYSWSPVRVQVVR